MAENEEVERDNSPLQKNKKKSTAGNPLLTVLVILNTVFILGIGVIQYSVFRQQSQEPTIGDIVKAEMKRKMTSTHGIEEIGMAKEEDGILFPLESFTANLAQGDGARRFVRMVAVLKFSRDSSEEEFQARKPQIRDTIINTLNSKRPEDLLRAEGKNFLKEEIKSSINSFLIDGKVQDVFYVSFQVN